ncbi:uncharacterized protein HaLaN_13611, partial [Haematococcus lacustris]
IAAVERTFAAAQQAPVHSSKSSMKAVEVLPLLPDEEWWGRRSVLVRFATDPCQEVGQLTRLDPELRRQAAELRFMALCVPTRPPSQPLRGEVAREALGPEYQWTKEYDVMDEGDERKQTVVLRCADGKALYSEIDTKAFLRRRDSDPRARLTPPATRPSKPREVEAARRKRMALEPGGDDEEAEAGMAGED